MTSPRNTDLPNTLFPGRPNYTGPTAGYFALLHHEVLFEKSHDVMERVQYVKRRKAEHEVPIRLHNMIHLPFMTDEVYADHWAKITTLYAASLAAIAALYTGHWGRATLDADILAFIRQHIPDCAWNGRELVFPEAA